MPIQGLDHVNIATTRLEETRAFYCDILGLAVGYRPDFKFPGYWLYAEGRPIVHLQGTAEAPSAQSPVRHVAFAVSSLAPFVARLTAAQIGFRRAATPDGRALQVFFDDPSGVRIELNCPSGAPRGDDRE